MNSKTVRQELEPEARRLYRRETELLGQRSVQSRALAETEQELDAVREQLQAILNCLGIIDHFHKEAQP